MTDADADAKSLQSCPTLRPHRQQPIRLLCPWDSPGKNIGVGCHFLLQCMKVKSESEVAQSCPTLSNPMDCSLPGSSVHGFSRQEYWSGVPLPFPLMTDNSTQLSRRGKKAFLFKNAPVLKCSVKGNLCTQNATIRNGTIENLICGCCGVKAFSRRSE